ncbi:MAG: methyltransferase domain-containing protein [Candidatus Methylomirabilales bacterium]
MFEDVYTSGRYLEQNPQWHVEESPWKAQQILRMLQKNRLAPKTICEVGCGAGEVLKQLQERMGPECEFWGYEVSPQAFALCQARANARLHFRLAGISEARAARCELLLVLDVLEHVEDYFGLLRAMQPISPDAIFHIPLDLSVQTVLRPDGLLKRRRLHAHIHYFSKEIALQLLRDVGYEVVDYFYTPRSIDLATEPVQRVLRPPRRLLFALSPDWAARLLGGFSLLVLARSPEPSGRHRA